MLGRAFAVCLISLFTLAAADAMENTEANRLREANRYLEASPPEEMVDQMAENMAKDIPEARKKEFVAALKKHIDLVSLRKTMVNSMVKHFTADELKALADFYGSPVGKSAMRKFGDYMGDVMPALQKDVMKAVSTFMNQGK